MFPTADGFHDGTDARRDRFTADELAGIDSFPFRSTELSLLAVSDRVVASRRPCSATRDLRIYSAEAWAKYTGAADYDQPLHRDYLNHTLPVPPTTAVPAAGDVRLPGRRARGARAPGIVPRTRTAGLPAKPNWYPRAAEPTPREAGS